MKSNKELQNDRQKKNGGKQKVNIKTEKLEKAKDVKRREEKKIRKKKLKKRQRKNKEI